MNVASPPLGNSGQALVTCLPQIDPRSLAGSICEDAESVRGLPDLRLLGQLCWKFPEQNAANATRYDWTFAFSRLSRLPADSLMCYDRTDRERSAAECHRRLPREKMGPAVWAEVHSGLSIFFTQVLFYF
jgi:hypothetical protein